MKNVYSRYNFSIKVTACNNHITENGTKLVWEQGIGKNDSYVMSNTVVYESLPTKITTKVKFALGLI